MLISFFALFFSFQNASASDLYVSEGQRVFCGNQSITRDYREPPALEVPTSDRELVQALRGRLFQRALVQADGQYFLEITVQLQLVSCVQEKQNAPFWYLEQPDAKDFAEATMPTGWFSGLIKNTKLEEHTVVNMETGATTIVRVARFRFELGMSLEDEYDIHLYYRYENLESSSRPAFVPYTPQAGDSFGPFGYFPGSFILHVEIADGKITRILGI